MNGQLLLASLKSHEGKKLRAYQDPKGIWTAGYGRNLQVMTVTEECAENWLQEDMYSAMLSAKKFPEFKMLDTDARQNAFIEMIYQMGPGSVSEFHNMRAAIFKGAWEDAAKAALDSDWARRDSPTRAHIIAEMIRTGEFPNAS